MAAHGKIWSASGGNLLIEQLTERELEVLTHVAAGARNREIASILNVSIKTVEFHLRNILSKLGVRSRTEAVVRAWQLDLLTAFLVQRINTVPVSYRPIPVVRVREFLEPRPGAAVPAWRLRPVRGHGPDRRKPAVVFASDPSVEDGAMGQRLCDVIISAYRRRWVRGARLSGFGIRAAPG